MNALDEQLYLQLKAQIDALIGGAGVSLGPVGATPNANAATLTGPVLNLEPGSDAFKGVVSVTQSNGLSIAAGVIAQAVATTSTAGAQSAFHKENLDSIAMVSLVGGGTTSDITAAITEAQGLGYKRVHLGDGTWVVNCGGLSDDSAKITVPTGFQITGNGPGRTIISVTNTTTGAGMDGVAVFRTASGAVKCIVDGLHFVGTNSGAFSYVLNNQNVCIDVHWAGTSRDIVIRNCYFESLWGFAVHDRNDANERVHLLDSTLVDCANGANVCASWSIQRGNVFVNSEGIETSGQHCVIANNTFKGALGVAITIGGNQSGGEFPGSIVANNTIDGGTGAGITVTDGCVAAIVANNTMRECEDGGLVLHGAVTPPHSCIIIGNCFDSNCKDPGANLVGMDVRDGSGKHLVYANISIDRGISGFNQKFALSLTTPDCVVFGNYFNGTLIDAQFSTGALRTREAGNVFANNTHQWLNTATRSSDAHTTKASTDVVFRTRVYNLSSLEARAYWSVDTSGMFQWGDNLNLLDTNLYRSAADTLKTDDALTVAGLLTGTAAATVTRNTTAAHVLTLKNLHSTGFSTMVAQDEGGTSRTVVGYDNDNNNAYLQALGAFRLILVTNGVARLVCGASGNVLIGSETDTATGILQVTGGASVTGQSTLSSPAVMTLTTGSVAGAGLQVINDDQVNRQLQQLDTYSGGATSPNNAAITFRSARGSLSSPSALTTDDLIGGIFGRPYHSGPAFTTSSRASFRLNAAQAQTASNQGCYATVFTTPLNSTTGALAAKFNTDGSLDVTAGITAAGVAVLSQTNAVTGITNKTFTSLTHSGTLALGTSTVTGSWSFSGTPTIGGAATLSGALTLSGANTYSGLSTFTSGVAPSQRSTTATTVTMATTDEIILASANSGAVTVNLQAAATATKRKLTVVKTDASANAVTLDGSGAETINGAATLALAAQFDRVTIVSDGTSWFRVD